MSWLYSLFMSKIFIAYWIICIVIIELQLRVLTKLKPKSKETKELD